MGKILSLFSKLKQILKNIKLSNVFDAIILNISFFLISFAWIKFLSKNNFTSTIFSILFLILFNVIIFLFSKNKSKKTQIKKEHQVKCEQSFLTLNALSKEETVNFFYSILKGYNPRKDDNNNYLYFKETQNIILYFDFESKNLKLEKVLKFLYSTKNIPLEKIYILCESCQANDKFFLENLQNFTVQIIEKEEIFNDIFLKNNKFPEFYFNIKKKSHLKLKQILTIGLNKKKAKTYFISGIFIFFCSLIVRYNFYYVFMSSVLFFLAILSLTRTKSSSP